MKKLILLILSVISISLISCSTDLQTNSCNGYQIREKNFNYPHKIRFKMQRDKKIIVFGDSISAPSDFSWINQFEKKTGCIVINKAVSGTGYTVSPYNYIEKMTKTILDSDLEDIDYVIVFGGINDIQFNRIPENIDVAFRRCCHKIRTKKVISIIPLIIPDQDNYPTNFDAKTALQIRQNFYKASNDYGFTIINAAMFDIERSDGLHPSVHGGMQLCDQIIQALKLD